ncbi:hypothetical protein [uncultured Algibacter sp.]|uniref:hypothetical protein n=1 Tax=uncultured Algibacter sp. TaxID=298659 RepID=UPI003216F82A
MKLLLYIITFLSLMSCKNKVAKSDCKVKDYKINDTVFKNTNILSSIYYDTLDCKINKLEIVTLLDNRSGNIKSSKDIKDIVVKFGLLKDTIVSDVINSKEIKLNKTEQGHILIFDYHFEKPFLDSINIIDLKTISLDYTSNAKKILKSDSYFYKNSAKILDIENTYLDYNAFSKNKIKFKTLSVNKTSLDSILVTIKANHLPIEDIKDYKIILNDNELNFKYNIKASFNNFKVEDNYCRIYDVKKLNSKFLQFKLNIKYLNLKKIDDFEIILDSYSYK